MYIIYMNHLADEIAKLNPSDPLNLIPVHVPAGLSMAVVQLMFEEIDVLNTFIFNSHLYLAELFMSNWWENWTVH